MGIVPENEHLLGLEAGGIVRRVHPSVTRFKPGDRVIVFEKGTFANRIILTTERTHHIPDDMSFEVRCAALHLAFFIATELTSFSGHRHAG